MATRYPARPIERTIDVDKADGPPSAFVAVKPGYLSPECHALPPFAVARITLARVGRAFK